MLTTPPNHWSTETTMIQYIDNIIGLYVRSILRELLQAPTTAGIVIMDNFKGKVTEKVLTELDKVEPSGMSSTTKRH